MVSRRLIAVAALMIILRAAHLGATETNLPTIAAPFLAKHCTSCHSGEKAEAGVRLDLPLDDLTDRRTFDT